MKLSNKILIGFFGLGFLYLTAAFTEVRFRGTPNQIDEENSIAEKVKLNGLTHLVLDGVGRHVKMTLSDEAYLEVRSMTGDLLKTITYDVSNDTLTIRNLKDDNRKFIVTLFVAKDFKGITAKNSTVGISGLRQDALSLSLIGGKTWLADNQIGTLDMTLTDKSYVEVTSTRLDTLTANIEESTVYVYSTVGVLRGEIRDETYLGLHDVEDIQLKKDKSSKMNLNH